MKSKAFLVAAACCLSSACGCISDNHHHEWTGAIERSAHDIFEPEILKVLDRQAAAWNAGDVDGFMAGYWRSPQLSFSGGGKVTRGFEPTKQHFRSRYPDKDAMGKLTFSDFEVTPLCRDAALVLGRFRVESSKPSSGAFSLIMRRIDGQWLVIHDHTSRDTS